MSGLTVMDEVSSVKNSLISIRNKEIKIEHDLWPCPEDKLGRTKEIENLSQLLMNAQAPLVFAVEASWGGGKTTFFRLWQQYLKTEGKVSLYLNAWENDFAEDPLLPLLSTLDKWLSKENNESKYKKAWVKAKACAPAIAKSTAVAAAKAATFGAIDIQKEYEKLVSDLAGEAVGGLIDGFNIKQKSLDRFKSQLSIALKALPSDQENLIVFVDELDRCRPTYAIEVLERIKHLFDLERLVFVLAINRDQLSKSFQGLYGPSFDGMHYLKRFIDLDYRLHVPEIGNYIKARISQEDIVKLFRERQQESNDYTFAAELIEFLARRFNYTVRDIEQFISRFSLVLRSIPSNHYLETPLLVMLMFLRQEDSSLYYRYTEDTMVANEALIFLLGGPIESVKLNYQLAIAAGCFLAVAREGYGEQVNFNKLIFPWKERYKDMKERNVANHETDVVIEWAERRKEYKGRVGMHKITFNRIELVSQIDIGM